MSRREKAVSVSECVDAAESAVQRQCSVGYESVKCTVKCNAKDTKDKQRAK